MTSWTSPRAASIERYSGWSRTAVSVVGGGLQVVDRLEQRRDADRAGRPALGAGVEQADLLEQDGDLQDVADRLAHADHVVRDRAGPQQRDLVRRREQDVELAAGVLGQLGVGPDQRPAQGQLAGQQLHPGGLVQRRVVVAHAGPRQQLPHDLLVDGGVLPHVQPAEVEAEDLHRLAQPEQPVVGQRPRAVAAQRGVDDVEVGAQLVRGVVRRQLDVDVRPGNGPAEHRRRGRGQPRRDAVECPAVGLVGPERRVVAGGLGQVVQLLRRGDQPVGHRQLVAERVELGQVVGQRRLGLAGGGPPQRVGGDERVAVAVAADPRAGQQHRPRQQPGVGPPLVQRPAQLGVEGRDDVEQRQLVVAQRLVDLVGQPQPGQPQQRRLPEGEHRAPQLGRPLGVVALAHRRPVALPDELGDLPLDVGDRLAPHLGRVRGDDRADQRPGQLPRDDVGRPGRPRRAAGRWRPGCPAAAASPPGGGTAGAARGGCPRPGWPAARSG